MIIFCSNDDALLTMIYFTTRSNFVTKAFEWEKSENSGFFGNYCIQWPENW